MSQELSLKGRDVLALEDFSAEEIRLILNTAREMKNIVGRDIKKVPALRGKAIVTLFYEPSTRTRTSFELAGKYLDALAVIFTTSAPRYFPASSNDVRVRVLGS